MSTSKKQITYSQVIALLEEGKTRKEIGEILEITAGEVIALFKHPKLKYKKPRKPVSFEFIVDDEETLELLEEEVSEEVAEKAVEEVVEEVSEEVAEEVEKTEPETVEETNTTDSQVEAEEETSLDAFEAPLEEEPEVTESPKSVWD